MAKTKKLPMTMVDVWEAYTCRCPACECAIIIREDVRRGDYFDCPGCKSVLLKVGDRYADHRKDDKPCAVGAEAMGTFF